MNAINCSVHFLTLKQVGYEESNVAVSFYHDRTHFDPNQRNQYAQYAEEFSLQQGRQFVLHNRLATTPSKMSKLKDQIKELDGLFQTSQESIKDTDTHLWSSVKNQSYFLSCLNSNLAKIIWLSSNRVLLIMHDGVLVWMIIDTVSGDLIKVLIDKSLTGVIGSSSSKLSGSVICDAALVSSKSEISNKLVSSLILAYSDKSIIDILTLEKHFSDHMKTWHNPQAQKLEKLGYFEPSLLAYEFSCPNVYRIEKRISLHTSSGSGNSTFTLWWPNDGQVVWHPKASDRAETQFSLLERDDLRNNVIVLSLQKGDKNLLEHMFKSDGLLLSCSYLNANSLMAVEQTETSTQKYCITVFRYDLPDDVNDEKKRLAQALKSNKIKLISFSLNSKIVSIEQCKVSQKYILMLNLDQTLILYEKNRNIVHKYKFTVDSADTNDSSFFNGVEWLIEDFLFAVYNINGQVCVFDIAFNQLDLNYMTRYTKSFKSISEYLNPNIFMPFETNSASINKKQNTVNNRFVRLISSRSICTESLWSCFHYSKGPFGLFKLNLPDNFNFVSLTNHYIRSSQSEDAKSMGQYLANAVNLLNQLDWDQEASVCLACLYRILNYILSGRVPFNLKTELLVEEALGSFYKPKRPLNEKTIYENKYQVSRYARKFFYQLLKNSSLNKAFLLAVDIGAKDLFNDLYYCALDRAENQLAEVCRKKYQEIVKEENQARLRNELNRSVTTIDDNIMGMNINEFDKYSVSSSENGTIESDNDSFCSLGEMEDLKANLEYLKVSGDGTGDEFRTYSEEDIQRSAKNIFSENKFIYDLNFDSMV